MDEVAVRIVATDRGIDPKKIRYRLERDRDLAKSSRLDHLIEINGFFATLVRACRNAGDVELLEWWSEQRRAAEWTGILDTPLVRPDGQAIIRSLSASCRFILELDRGTERGDRLSHKLQRYRLIAGHDDAPESLLFLFPTLTREINARRSLDIAIGLQVATSHRELFEETP
jgi:hypothetical protein